MLELSLSMPLALGWKAIRATLVEIGSPLVLISLKPQASNAEQHVRLDLGKRMFIDQAGEAPAAVQDSLIGKANEIAQLVSTGIVEKLAG